MALTVKRADREKRPGRYLDAHGLYLQITKSGSRSWLFRWERTVQNSNGSSKRCERCIGLGPTHTVSLEEARELARQCRWQLLSGSDPLENRRAERAATKHARLKRTTFAEAARQWHLKQLPTYRNAKHAEQVIRSLENYAFPVFGDVDVAAVDTDLIVTTLKPHWSRIPETASRVRGRIEAVLDAASVAKLRTGDNPARWSSHLEHLFPSPQKLQKGERHFAALPYADLPAFLKELSTREGIASIALKFLILTASRTAEVIGATWDEIDLGNRLWTIPAARMKASAEHRVPLSDAVVEILKSVPQEAGNPYVFISPQTKGKGLSNLAMLSLLKVRMGYAQTTVHGFRSTFSDWAHETTAFPNHVIEISLAHQIGSAVERSYRRGDMFMKRRKLMDAWARFCTIPRDESGATVADLSEARLRATGAL